MCNCFVDCYVCHIESESRAVSRSISEFRVDRRTASVNKQPIWVLQGPSWPNETTYEKTLCHGIVRLRIGPSGEVWRGDFRMGKPADKIRPRVG